MVFSSPLFLFLFLPIVLISYYLIRRDLRNVFLLLSSLFFYTWGEQLFVFVMLASIFFNYILGLFAHAFKDIKGGYWVIVVAVILNIGLLGTYKYANFIVDNTNLLLTKFGFPPVHLDPVHLPIGISFFTFQALSYVIDVYRKEAPLQRNPINVALYISLFPQLIAGPIVRYHDIAAQLFKRSINWDGFSYGIHRFTMGLGKKVLIANIVAIPVDEIFSLAPGEISFGLAWLGTICYALQIYFDFSGYSDMAIGLGHMFGFKFLENFNFPYISKSIQEFWRRWHISLSSWFRDYLYIPLGGNRISSFRTYFNLIVVFFLCGLWHGASWNFVIWGLYHGLFLVIERLGFSIFLKRLWKPIRHLYVIIVVLIGWVFFRAETLPMALSIISSMFSLSFEVSSMNEFLDNLVLVAIFFGIIFSTNISLTVKRWFNQDYLTRNFGFRLIGRFTYLIMLLTILFLSSMQLASNTHNPFIYFRF